MTPLHSTSSSIRTRTIRRRVSLLCDKCQDLPPGRQCECEEVRVLWDHNRVSRSGQSHSNNPTTIHGLLATVRGITQRIPGKYRRPKYEFSEESVRGKLLDGDRHSPCLLVCRFPQGHCGGSWAARLWSPSEVPAGPGTGTGVSIARRTALRSGLADSRKLLQIVEHHLHGQDEGGALGALSNCGGDLASDSNAQREQMGRFGVASFRCSLRFWPIAVVRATDQSVRVPVLEDGSRQESLGRAAGGHAEERYKCEDGTDFATSNSCNGSANRECLSEEGLLAVSDCYIPSAIFKFYFLFHLNSLKWGRRELRVR